jgi:hypothetical protein
MERLWCVKELVPLGSTSCSSASLLFLSELNSLPLRNRVKVLIPLACSFVPQKPYLFKSFYREIDYRHLRSTHIRARVLWRKWRKRNTSGAASTALGGVRGAFEGVRGSKVDRRRRAEKGDGGESGPFVGERAALIGRRISERVEDGRDEAKGGAWVLPGAAAGAGGVVAVAR